MKEIGQTASNRTLSIIFYCFVGCNRNTVGPLFNVKLTKMFLWTSQVKSRWRFWSLWRDISPCKQFKNIYPDSNTSVGVGTSWLELCNRPQFEFSCIDSSLIACLFFQTFDCLINNTCQLVETVELKRNWV